MFQPSSEQGYRPVLEKIRMKSLVHGDATMMVEFRLEAGANLPSHSHPHEQTGYLVSGEIELTIGDDIHQVTARDCWCIPGDVEHKAAALADCVAIEVFSPVREDYLV